VLVQKRAKRRVNSGSNTIILHSDSFYSIFQKSSYTCHI